MGDEEDGNGPEDRTQRRRRELSEIGGHVVGIAFQLPSCRGIDVLQTPTADNSVVAGDKEAGGNAEKADELREEQAPATRCFAVSSRGLGHLCINTTGVSCTMTTDDELTQHAGNAKQQHAAQVDKDEGSTTVLAGHIGESPYIAQSDSRSCRCKNDAQFASEVRSFRCM